MKIVAWRGKKREILGPHPSGPPSAGPPKISSSLHSPAPIFALFLSLTIDLHPMYPEKKKPRTQPKFHGTTPSLPLPLGPHFFWVVVSVCAAPDSGACCCFSCCFCSCCGLLLPLAFGPPTVEPRMLDFSQFDFGQFDFGWTRFFPPEKTNSPQSQFKVHASPNKIWPVHTRLASPWPEETETLSP